MKMRPCRRSRATILLPSQTTGAVRFWMIFVPPSWQPFPLDRPSNASSAFCINGGGDTQTSLAAFTFAAFSAASRASFASFYFYIEIMVSMTAESDKIEVEDTHLLLFLLELCSCLAFLDYPLKEKRQNTDGRYQFVIAYRWEVWRAMRWDLSFTHHSPTSSTHSRGRVLFLSR